MTGDDVWGSGPAGWVPVWVRLEDYEDVTRQVLAREVERESPADVPPAGAGDRPGGASGSSGLSRPAGPLLSGAARRTLEAFEPWAEDDLRTLAASTTQTTLRWSRALDVLCERAEEFVSSEQVAELAEMGITEWRDAPRKIGKHLEAHYPGVPGWPAATLDGRDLGHRDGQAYWAVTVEQARRWRRVRGASGATPAQAPAQAPARTS